VLPAFLLTPICDVNMPLPIPCIPLFQTFAVDEWAIFIVSMLLAVMIHAEGQGYVATILGDHQVDSRKRLHFNAFLHLDPLGTLCFFVAGFGWPRRVEVDASRFSNPCLYQILVRLCGPFANLLMASIAGSIVWVLGRYGVQDRVFIMVVIVNLTMAVYHLIPIPPLAASALYLVPAFRCRPVPHYLNWAGGMIVLIYFILTGYGFVKGVGTWLNPLINRILHYLITG